ncbi:uncharacterized protein [Prorops nasuta]|uniref:uncharacterized protein n=1 Tax=Prorops nasuta TaxID=863751 RepID=UPI0034CDDFD3
MSPTSYAKGFVYGVLPADGRTAGFCRPCSGKVEYLPLTKGMTSDSSTGLSIVRGSSSQRPNIHREATQSGEILDSSTSHDAAMCLAKGKTSLDDILMAVREVGDSQKGLTLKVNTLLELPQRMEDCIDRVNELKREQDALSGRICLLEEQHAQLAARVECLDSRPPGSQNTNADASQIQALTSAINNIEVKQHSCDLTVSGIPESVESDVGDFLRRLFALMGLTVALSDMTGIRRMRSILDRTQLHLDYSSSPWRLNNYGIVLLRRNVHYLALLVGP